MSQLTDSDSDFEGQRGRSASGASGCLPAGGGALASEKPSDQAAPQAVQQAQRRSQSRYILIAGLIFLAMVIFLSTALFLLNFVEGSSAPLAVLFAASALMAVTLMTIVGLRFWRIYRDRRTGLAGSRMHTKLVGLLSVVAIAPAVITFTFSTIVLQRMSQDLLIDRINMSVTNAVNLANGYFGSNSIQMGNGLVDLALDVKDFEDRQSYAAAPITLRQYLLGQAIVRGWSAIYLLDGERRILLRAEVTPHTVLDYKLPAGSVFDRIDQGRDIASRYDFNAVDSEKLDLYYGVLKIQPFNEGYIIAFKEETPLIASQLLAVREFRDSSAEFQGTLANLRVVFLIGFGLLALIILLVAVWAGLLVSNAIVQPISRLSHMANQVSGGDLSARVEPRKSDGELGDLARAFNHMTAQLETQRDDLVSAHQQSDERRRFIEAVLSGVPAGVMGLSSDGRVTIANRMAAEFLGSSPMRMTGASLKDLSPGIYEIFEQAKRERSNEASGQVELQSRGITHLLSVRIGGDGAGYVATFDDITQLVSAQRSAAWGDVARRIAHEIKNPLTPIQLSAERLRRKYSKEITSNPEVFTRCTDTIIKHVGDIGRMVNEFSSFARMPEPVMREEDLREIVKEAVFVFQVAAPEIEFEISAPDTPVLIRADGRLLAQACTNLVKNAVEAISEPENGGGERSVKGKIRIEIDRDQTHARIAFIDNGKGLPEKSRHRLTEPYMTTREKGTGLGLAIVRKVIEEHQGILRLENDLTLGGKTGTRVSIIIPLKGAVRARAENAQQNNSSPKQESVK